MVLWPVSPVYIMCNKIAQNRHDEPFFTMNTPRCEVTTSTNLGQIRASSPPTRELTCTLVCGQKSKHSQDEDLDFLQEAQVSKAEPTIRRNHRADMLFLRLGYWFSMPGTVDSRAKFRPKSCEHNFRHNGTIFRVTLKSRTVKSTSIMCLTLKLPQPKRNNMTIKPTHWQRFDGL